MLRQGPAARLAGGGDLQLRMHLLHQLRRDGPRRPLPELRRRLRLAADPADREAGPLSGLDGPRAQARGMPAARRPPGLNARASRRWLPEMAKILTHRALVLRVVHR